MNFHVKTYGCQMNARDSEALGVLLSEKGYVPNADEATADLVIVNTCSVRGKAESKALGKLGLLASGKRYEPERMVGAVGCMVQRLKHDIFRKVPGLDFAVGPRRLSRLGEVIEQVRDGKGPVLDVGEFEESGDKLLGHVPGRVSAFVNILHGCNRGCAYCIVPRVRGRERSRTATEIVREIEALAAQGTREVVLLGQSVMSYGRQGGAWESGDPSPRGYREPLPRLLEAVDAIEGIRRVRFTSGHPSGCSQELARAMAELPSVCDHLHLPLQSGSDRVLKMMRRGYDSDGYRRAVATLKESVPALAVTTDIIVGFPTETLAEFETTRSLMDEIGFDSAFIFKYSPRPDTPAAEWEDTVPADEKLRRNKVLLADQDARSEAIREGMIGSTVEVLVEGVSARNPARWSGRTGTNRIVVFDKQDGMHEGDLVSTKIGRATPQTLYGRVVE